MKQTEESGFRLACVNIVTPDAMRLASFYRDVLGASVDDSRGGPGRVEIWFGPRDQAVLLVVNAQPDFVPPRYTVCQGVEIHVPDVDAIYERLCEAGMDIKALPRDLPWGYRYFHISDPDGNGIDLVQKINK